MANSLVFHFVAHNGTQESRSLPSQETSMNEHPSSRGGVGVLPGGRNEISVTKLPEERFQEGTGNSTGHLGDNCGFIFDSTIHILVTLEGKYTNDSILPEFVQNKTFFKTVERFLTFDLFRLWNRGWASFKSRAICFWRAQQWRHCRFKFHCG